MKKTESTSPRSVGRARLGSKSKKRGLLNDGTAVPTSKIDGTTYSQAARAPAMAEFAASIAHEIRQPLSSVVLNAEASLRWLTRSNPNLDEARCAISTAARDGMRAGEMVQSLLALVLQSRPVLSVCCINDVIREALDRTHEERQRHGVLLSLDLFADNSHVFGNRTQLQQVVYNLAMNGIEAMRTVTNRPRVLTISLQPAERASVVVAVGDTGPGIDPAIADGVFEPFFKTKPGGMGMGLSVCRSIVETYGGRIWASSREVCGTVFRFIVPVATDPDAEE
jgi:signal transduction histidine kinase